MICEHDQVVLTEDVPDHTLKAGDVGVIVHTYDKGKAYEVEFLTLAGETAAVLTLRGDQVRAIRDGEIAHARERLAA